jgi:hypothetical protein
MPRYRPTRWCSPAPIGFIEREPQAINVEERYLDTEQLLSRKEPPARVEHGQSISCVEVFQKAD